MEFFLKVLEVVTGSALAFAGVILYVRRDIKIKKMDNEAKKNDDLVACQQKHSANLDTVKNEYNVRLDGIDTSLNEIKTELLKIALSVTQLQKDISSNVAVINNVLERIGALEKDFAVLDNRESVSEHRLTDLEKLA